ncbi:MAG: hypothetical protein HY226_04855 [Candidatus Vogelbacteria bacterium]|nr:hypothetical protein [Candidatus Vogelbacteria bacterium]
METFKQPNSPEATESDETNEVKIDKDFVKMPSDKIELLANHLMRPDGFIKTLIIGKILTSEEITRTIGLNFVRTHRGFYKTFPRPTEATQSKYGTNKDIAFAIGAANKMYAIRRSGKRSQEAIQGLGFVLPAKRLLEKTNSTPVWGNFDIADSLKKVNGTQRDEQQFEKYKSLDFKGDRKIYEKYEWNTPKEDVAPLVNLSRKQAEVQLKPEAGILPNLSINETIILIPQPKREALRRLFEIKKRSLASFREKIKDAYGVDIENISFEDVEKRYQGQIYWYPQKNIDLAVQYLTTHPEKIKEFYTEELPDSPTL